MSEDGGERDSPHPRETTALFGHADAERSLLEATRAAASRMPG